DMAALTVTRTATSHDAPTTTEPASAPTEPFRWRALAVVVVPLALLGLWHLLTAVTGVFASYQLPAPAAVWAAGSELAADGTLWTHVAISTQRVLLGFAVGAAAGLAVGALVGLSRWADTLLAG